MAGSRCFLLQDLQICAIPGAELKWMLRPVNCPSTKTAGVMHRPLEFAPLHLADRKHSRGSPPDHRDSWQTRRRGRVGAECVRLRLKFRCIADDALELIEDFESGNLLWLREHDVETDHRDLILLEELIDQPSQSVPRPGPAGPPVPDSSRRCRRSPLAGPRWTAW